MINLINSYLNLKNIIWRGFLICWIPLMWNGCADTDTTSRTGANNDMDPAVLSSQGVDAVGPFFTSDQNGASVVVWSEKLEGGDSTGYVIKYSRLSTDGGEVVSTTEVSPSRGCTTTAESMNKIAFKEDGTVVAVFTRRAGTSENRFAGAIHYTQSFDDGVTWAPENYLHVGDTTKGLSRSFFDIATLPDGEVGAIWLDSRMTQTRGDGSTLFFSKTQDDQGFLKDQAIGAGTCECCRTELFVSKNGDIHALYRDIWHDSIRDISHIISQDHGKTFSKPARISTDDWVIYGCPHTGPSMSEQEDELNIVWFTMGGDPGLYHTRYDSEDEVYSPKKMLTRDGRHPQVLTSGKDQLVFLWEESEGAGQHSNHMNHGAPEASISLKSFSDPKSVIKAQVWQEGHPLREHWVSLPDHFAELPVGISLPDGFIGVAWIQKNDDESGSVMYRRIKA